MKPPDQRAPEAKGEPERLCDAVATLGAYYKQGPCLKPAGHSGLHWNGIPSQEPPWFAHGHMGFAGQADPPVKPDPTAPKGDELGELMMEWEIDEGRWQDRKRFDNLFAMVRLLASRIDGMVPRAELQTASSWRGKGAGMAKSKELAPMPSKSPAAMLRGLADRARDPRQHPTWDSVSLKPDTVRLIAEVLEAAEDTKEDAAPYACGDSKWCDSADHLDTALSKLTAALESK